MDIHDFYVAYRISKEDFISEYSDDGSHGQVAGHEQQAERKDAFFALSADALALIQTIVRSPSQIPGLYTPKQKRLSRNAYHSVVEHCVVRFGRGRANQVLKEIKNFVGDKDFQLLEVPSDELIEKKRRLDRLLLFKKRKGRRLFSTEKS